MALLNYEERDERIWKIDIATYLKKKKDHEEEVRKHLEHKNELRKQELERMEIEAQKLRDQGKCRVRFNPHIIQYKSASTGRNIKIRMDYLNSYPERTLKIALNDLKDSSLLEEMEARIQILISMEENAKKAQERKDREAAENWARFRSQMPTGP